MKLIYSFALAVSLTSLLVAADKSIDGDVQAVFAELRTLKSMAQRQTYTLSARGEKLTGRGDDFLRRRTADEIAESKLSCGCGDYAAVFAERIQARGFEALLIDSALISLHSLVNKFDGHVVVAIRPSDAPKSPWSLVDSTALNIISRDWSPDAKTFTSSSGSVYWIGYCGTVEKYPVRTPDELKKFYADTLAKVPTEFFNRTLYRLMFTVDKSLIDEKGNYLNPRVTRLQREQDEILARYQIKPAREIPIVLTRGGDDASGDLKYSATGGWVGRVGLKSACSPSFLSYLDQKVRNHEESVAR
jgi:hypothetical protein